MAPNLILPDLTSLVTLKEVDRSSFVVSWENGVLMGHVYREMDGYWVFDDYLSAKRGGFKSQESLLAIGQLLWKMNREWDETVRREIGGG